MATGFFKRIILGAGLTGTDNGDDTITIDSDAAGADILTTKGDLLTQDPNGTYIRLPIGSTDEVLTVASGLPDWVARIKSLCKFGGTPLAGDVTLSEGSNVTLTQSGNDITIAATVVGSGAVDSIAAAGDTPMTGDIEIAAGSGITVTQDDVDTLTIAASGGGPGASELIFRYTVTGSDKADIDTGVDTADAGSGDWTNGDVLEVFVYARTDEAVVASFVNMTVNNDATSIYDTQRLSGISSAASAASLNAQASWQWSIAGANNASGVFGIMRACIPNYMSSVANKVAELSGGWADTNAANSAYSLRIGQYRSTAAISRIKIIPVTAAKKFKVGTQIAIYKRLAS